MPELIPVEHDPFTPMRMTPVDHDPFMVSPAVIDAMRAVPFDYGRQPDNAGPLARVGPLSQAQTDYARALINTPRIPGQNGGPSLEPVEHTWQEGRTPSFAEALSGGIQTGLRAAGMDTYDARHFGNAATSLGSLFPPVGIPMAADELYSAAQNRDLFGGALASIGLLPMAKGALTAAKGAARTFPIAETAARQEQRLAAGYPHVVEVDAGGFKNAFERDQKTPLVWNQEKLDRLQNVTPDAYPFAYMSNGKVAVDDGAHRIGLAAQRGESIPVAVPDEAAGQQLLGRIGSGDVAPPIPGIRAYHGSPHDFDRFSLDKIGTGEGAQAYGHGLYLAESEPVAKSYKAAGPASNAQYDAINNRLSELSKEMDKISTGYRRFSDPERGKQLAAEYDSLMDKKANLGHMYEVNIKADPERFLDWDKPLSEQSQHVQEAIKSIIGDGAFKTLRNEPARTVYNEVHPIAGRATGLLRDAGIPGIRYLDQGSRNIGGQGNPALRRAYIGLAKAETAGNDAKAADLRKQIDGMQSRNYVAFDDRIIDIIRKYGIAGLMGGAAAYGALGAGKAKADTPTIEPFDYAAGLSR